METQLEHELMLMGDRQKGVLFGGTHPDIFHPDDVLCAVILRTELPQYRWQWIRTRNDDLLAKCNIVFDVGGGTYDHHGAPIFYPNGVMMAACGKVLNDMPENQRPEKNLIVIMTDGEENSSREYQPSKVREMIKHQEDKYNWTFLYIGTDISNTDDADRVGVSYKFANIRSKLGKAYDTVNSVVSCYRNTVGDSVTKAATMDSFLTAKAATMNSEYKKDTGIDID